MTNRSGELALGQMIGPIIPLADKPGRAIGTGFRILRSNLVVTAKHVVSNHDKYLFASAGDGGNDYSVSKEVHFPSDENADLAALIIEDNKPKAPYFNLAKLEESDPLLGEKVGTYGYPILDPNQYTPRLMFDYIQRVFNYPDRGKEKLYMAYELGFPSFPGQSGSPVFLNRLLAPHDRRNVLGVVTNSITVTGRRSEHAATWSIGLSLLPFREWLLSL